MKRSLCFGERVGTFLLHRVLRGHDDERGWQLVGHADGHLLFLHGLKQSCLRLGRRTVDLVSEEGAEQRTGL